MNVTLTAFRVDWETATPKALRYSIFFTFLCIAEVITDSALMQSPPNPSH